MAGGKSEYWALAYLNWLLRGDALPVIPGTLYLALSSISFPTTSSIPTLGFPMTPAQLNEPASNTGYARQAVARTHGNWAAPSGFHPSAAANVNQVNWPAALVDYASPVRSVWLVTAATGGQLLEGCDVGPSDGSGIPVHVGDIPTLSAGYLTVRDT